MERPGRSEPRLPIMVKVWSEARSHRFRYIRRSLTSLFESHLPSAARVVLVDDVSSDPRVNRLLAELTRRPGVEVWTNPERMGPNGGQAYNFPKLVNAFPEATHFVLCDDDIIYHPEWLRQLLAVAEEARAEGLTGIFTALNVPFRPSHASRRLPTSEVLLKERQAALNWLLPKDVYQRVGPFRDTGIAYDTEYCDRLAALGLPVVCMKPSYVQNIGYFGAYQSSNVYRARDFVGREGLWIRASSVALTTLHFARRLKARVFG
jgi:hypothetical protein